MTSDALKTVSVVDAVADGLRRAIYGGELTAGVQLSETSLSARFGVPRPTIRSAVLIVQQEGLLRREHHRSCYIPVLSRDDIVDLFFVRRMVELEAARRIVSDGIVPVGAQRAQRILEALDESDGWDEVVTYDFALHQALVDAIDSPRLSRIHQSISAETRLGLTQLRTVYTSPTQIAAEHRVLLAAITSGDLDQALAAVRHHLDESEQILLDGLSR